MPSSPLTTDAFLDAAGEACGTVTPLIRQTLTAMLPDQVLEVLTHDAATRVGVPAWCRLTGNELVATHVEDGAATRFWIRRTPKPSQPT